MMYLKKKGHFPEAGLRYLFYCSRATFLT